MSSKRSKKVEEPAEKLWFADRTERRSIDDLEPYARNARLHSDEQVAQIARSIETFGFTVPVLISSDGGIIAGHGRVLAARQLGLAEVPCIIAPDDWDEDKRRAYVLADNRIAESGEWDAELLKVELGALIEVGINATDLGFSDEELNTIMNGWEADLDKTNKVAPELSDMTATIKVKVNQTQKDEVVQVLKDALDVAGYGDAGVE